MTFSVAALPRRSVCIGRTGENQYTTLTFDVSAWLAEYPGADVLAVYRRPDGVTYVVARAQAGEQVLRWTVSDTDVCEAGFGEVELRVMLGDMVGKSDHMSVRIQDSLVAGERPAQAPSDWIGSTMQRITKAEQATLQASALSQDAALRAQRADEGASEAANAAGTAANEAKAAAEQALLAADCAVEHERSVRNTFAGALTGESVGAAVTLDDVSSVPHTVSCRVYGKNLIQYPYRNAQGEIVTKGEKNGVSYTVREDGGIEVSGATGENTTSGFDLYLGDMLLPAGTYTAGGDTGGVAVAVRYLVNGEDTSFNYIGMNTRSVSEPFVINRISLYVPVNTVVPEGTVIYPTFQMGDVAMETYEKSGSGTVRTCGKNLLDVSGEPTLIGGAYPGVDITKIASTLGGSACLSITLKQGKTVPTDCYFGFVYDYVKSDGTVTNNATWLLTPEKGIISSYAKIPTNWNSVIGVGAYPATQSGITKQKAWEKVLDAFDIQLEIGTSATEYEPYMAGETVTADLPAVLKLSSIAPNMSVIGEAGLTLYAKYNRDVNTALERIEQAIISLGGKV